MKNCKNIGNSEEYRMILFGKIKELEIKKKDAFKRASNEQHYSPIFLIIFSLYFLKETYVFFIGIIVGIFWLIDIKQKKSYALQEWDQYCKELLEVENLYNCALKKKDETL